ncbi:hypothetical protein DFH28DRAFT_1139497 [Melampsora americana]|nr:hypothetical protein DFH28DRAFT_1139497 [Melampsora americana]
MAPRTNQAAKPYKRPNSQSFSPPGCTSRGSSNHTTTGQTCPSQPAEALPHQAEPSRPADEPDLDDFNFVNNHTEDLKTQIMNAIEDQAELERNTTALHANSATAQSTSTPIRGPTHLSGTRLVLFNQLATRSRLEDESMSMGRFLCNVEAPMTIEAIKRISSSPGALPDGSTWKADGAELKQACKTKWAMQSAMLSNPSEWKNRVLPPGYGTNPDPQHTRTLESTMNVVLKELLTHINLPNQVQVGSHANVPMLDTVIVKLYQKECGLIGGRVRVREEILQDVDQARTSCYAWLRMQAIHWGLNFAEYEGWSFWNVVDCQLAYLRSQSTRYRYAQVIVLPLGLAIRLRAHHGTKTFEELKETTLSLPTKTQIQDTMDELNLTFGEEVQPDEEAQPVEEMAT